MSYNSKPDTLEHIAVVRGRLETVVDELIGRAEVHDASKLDEPERSMYDEFVPKLREMTYGSNEYRECLLQMGAALQHHYAENGHHPEHWPDGVRGMSLLDVVEMLCDWSASISRVKDGDLRRSIAINQERFGYSDELREILLNTANELGW